MVTSLMHMKCCFSELCGVLSVTIGHRRSSWRPLATWTTSPRRGMRTDGRSVTWRQRLGCCRCRAVHLFPKLTKAVQAPYALSVSMRATARFLLRWYHFTTE